MKPEPRSHGAKTEQPDGALLKELLRVYKNKHVLLISVSKTKIVPSTWESEAGELAQASGQPRLWSETLSHKTKKGVIRKEIGEHQAVMSHD